MKRLFTNYILLLLSIIIFSCSKEDSEIIPPQEETPLTPTPSDPSLTAFSSANEHLLDSVINYVLTGNQIPGIVVGVRSPTYGTYKKAFGVSDYVAQTPMQADAIFGIGSVHKNFKFILAHILAEEGVFSLDDTVNQYVAKPILPGVTIRHLMQHSAGLPDIPSCSNLQTHINANLTFDNPYDTIIHFLDNASGTIPFGPFTNGRLANFTPGVNSNYSSFGPVILAEIIKITTGKNIRDMIDEKIIIPLGLNATSHISYQPDPALLTPGHGNYTTVSTFTPTGLSIMGTISANGGAIHSDVSDLLHFTHTQFTNSSFLSSSTISSLYQQNLQALGMKIGLGVIQFNDWAPSNFWGHAGFGTRAHSSTMFHNKTHQLSIVVLTNIYTPVDNFQTNYAISEAIINALH